jgi:hypothetical protein
MEKNLGATLQVNGAGIGINQFVEQFLIRIVVGAVSSLKGGEDMHYGELLLEGGNLTIGVNGNELPLTPFPEDIITNTITGLVSSLKGVSKIRSLKIDIRAK